LFEVQAPGITLMPDSYTAALCDSPKGVNVSPGLDPVRY
jgi:hypothetical protein